MTKKILIKKNQSSFSKSPLIDEYSKQVIVYTAQKMIYIGLDLGSMLKKNQTIDISDLFSKIDSVEKIQDFINNEPVYKMSIIENFKNI